MRRSSTLSKTSMKSLALSVHFKHPDLGMKEYEILSRASAFLLSVDPVIPSAISTKGSLSYAHLAKSQRDKDDMNLKQNYLHEPAGGPPRDVKELRWLEFCPGTFRPLVHIMASSHVLSPWRWKDYYPQPWLKLVNQDHVRYSIDVYDSSEGLQKNAKKSLCTFGLNPYPIHHPNDMDLALIHLKSEGEALKHMQALGVEMLHLTDNNTLFERNDEVIFEGFEIMEDNLEHFERIHDDIESRKLQQNAEEDVRVFMPYKTKGNLIFASPRRFIAKTPAPLPEGLCGGPVLDDAGCVCGIVEGIIPKDHKDKALAGAASFIPYFRVREFVDYAERLMLEKIVPKLLFDKVVQLKKGNALNERTETSNTDAKTINFDETYSTMIDQIRANRTPEQVDAILGTVEREQQEILQIIDQDGGDLDEIIAKVRANTRLRQREILQQIASDNPCIEEAAFLESESQDNKSTTAK